MLGKGKEVDLILHVKSQDGELSTKDGVRIFFTILYDPSSSSHFLAPNRHDKKSDKLMELRSTAFASGKNIDNAHQTPSSSAQIHIEETVESWSRSNGTSTHIHCGLHTPYRGQIFGMEYGVSVFRIGTIIRAWW